MWTATTAGAHTQKMARPTLHLPQAEPRLRRSCPSSSSCFVILALSVVEEVIATATRVYRHRLRPRPDGTASAPWPACRLVALPAVCPPALAAKALLCDPVITVAVVPSMLCRPLPKAYTVALEAKLKRHDADQAAPQLPAGLAVGQPLGPVRARRTAARLARGHMARLRAISATADGGTRWARLGAMAAFIRSPHLPSRLRAHLDGHSRPDNSASNYDPDTAGDSIATVWRRANTIICCMTAGIAGGFTLLLSR
jgi:hypothetical protein